MKDKLTRHLLGFLRKNIRENQSILLALSGGNDSLALFHLLLLCQKEIPFCFGVAHIDHGWRKESGEEALLLKKLCEEYAIPFHLKSLSYEGDTKNLEAKCRTERLHFFEELCRDHNYQAVVLAHHLDDQAETVLKNIFEGANLCACNGIAQNAEIGNLKLWRPFLDLSKKELSDWLEAKKLTPFTDKTNFDTKFLRARMRKDILPHLENLFGKQIKQSLKNYGKDSSELKEFMHKHLNKIINSCVTTSLGTFIDLKPFDNLTVFEIKFILRQVCSLEGSLPSRALLENVAFHLQAQSVNKEFTMGPCRLYVDRARLFVTRDKSLIAEKISCTKKIFMILNVKDKVEIE